MFAFRLRCLPLAPTVRGTRKTIRPFGCRQVSQNYRSFSSTFVSAEASGAGSSQARILNNGVPLPPRPITEQQSMHGRINVNLASGLQVSPFDDVQERDDVAMTGPFRDDRGLFFESGDAGNRSYVSNRWLRDQCPCNQCVHPETRQRQLETFKIDRNVSISSFSILQSEEPLVKVEWQDGHLSVYSQSLLERSKRRALEFQRRGLSKRSLFTSDIAKAPPTVDYQSIMQGHGIGEWTRQINTHGFSFVEGCPVDPIATQKLLEQIGPIRETHYGGFYDFTSNMASKDTAYTTLSLEAHTDTTYFSDPAGLQMFHMLSHTGGSGGESLLVDGFAAAAQLYHEDKEAYRILSTVPIWAHASGNEDVSIQPYTCFPVLLHDPVMGHLVQVRWNNSDRAGIEADNETVEMWYDAAAKYNRLLNEPKNQYWTQLLPGVPLIFDNWRVLHGRSAFTGKRRMAGGYINRDDFISKYKLTNMSREQVLKATVTG